MDTLVDWGSHIEQVVEDLSKDVTDADRERLRGEFSSLTRHQDNS